MKHYLLEKETYEILGACMEVHTELGSGFSEIVYKDSLELELKERGIPYEREKKFQVKFKGNVLPHYFVVDFVILDSVILEIKTVSEIANIHFEQTMNYMAASGLSVGLLVNFRKLKLEYKRLILTPRGIRYYN